MVSLNTASSKTHRHVFTLVLSTAPNTYTSIIDFAMTKNLPGAITTTVINKLISDYLHVSFKINLMDSIPLLLQLDG